MHIGVRAGRIVGVVALVGALAGGTALAGTQRTTKVAKVTKVGIATPAKTNDYGWNQQGVKAARAAAKAARAQIQVITNIGYDKTEVVLRQLATGGANFIIAHASGYDTVAARLAQQLKVPVITYDIPTQLVKNYVSNITTSSEQASYLAGLLAARTTKTHKVGIVVSANDPNWFKMSGGFAAGFRKIDKKSKIYFAVVSPTGYDDSAGGKRVAASVIARGADVLFCMGDGATFGYLQAIETAKAGHKVWMIGDIGNLTPIDKKHVFLSSVLWSFTRAYKAAIKDINNGTYGTHGYNLSLANGGVSLLKTRYIKKSVWKQIQKTRTKIVKRKLKVPVATTKAAVQKLIK
jgi:basic membrane protein A and related proteins